MSPQASKKIKRAPASAPVKSLWHLWIGGKAVSSLAGKRFVVHNPANGQKLTEVAQGDAADVDAAVSAARRAFDGPWAKFGPRDRARALFKFAQAVRDHREELALLETYNTGKPIGDSRGEVAVAADCFEYYAGAVTKYFGSTIPVSATGLDFTLRQPMGVCGLVVPWNFPIMITAWKLAPALACGNTAVIKPASYTPLTALRLAQLCEEAGIPEGVVNVVPGPGDVAGQALAAHPGVAKISFTGETATGERVLRAAAATIKRVSLELGGKSPNIVFADCDLERCVEKSVFSVFGNAGQDCCARSRALVEKSAVEEFVGRFAERTRKIVVGDPLDEATQVGPMISRQQRERVQGYVALGQKEGARLVCGGGLPEDVRWKAGHFLMPAVLSEARPGMRVAQEEIFGPVLCVLAFDGEEEAVRLANDTPYGLSGSIWTRDLSKALRVARRVESGNLSVNSATSVYLEAPFGGFKRSGVGRELGMGAMDLYSEVKNVFVEHG
ncbi:MAG: aldehyde dehydrogenase [Elusimicrobia bacterium]|nr:aldehyde dehydrogenase [Elusimicrobiota bacterium]